MTWFQSDFSALKMSGSGDMKSSGDMTKVSSVPYFLLNQVEIASVLLKKEKKLKWSLLSPHLRKKSNFHILVFYFCFLPGSKGT